MEAKAGRAGPKQRKVHFPLFCVIKKNIELTFALESFGKSSFSAFVIFQAIVHLEGHMDDGLTLSRAQAVESRTATVIRRTGQIFCNFIA